MRSRMNTDFKENRVRLSAAAALLLPSLLFCSCSAQDRWQPVEVVAEAVEAPVKSAHALLYIRRTFSAASSRCFISIDANLYPGVDITRLARSCTRAFISSS